jgi:hypothetical protein
MAEGAAAGSVPLSGGAGVTGGIDALGGDLDSPNSKRYNAEDPDLRDFLHMNRSDPPADQKRL